MDPLLCLSPHLDDVALSMGQVLAGRPDAVIATMFTATPNRGRTLTTYDRNCGFRNARQAMVERRREDRAAMDLLSARSVHLGHLDHQYRPDGTVPDEDEAVEQISTLVDDLAVEQIVGPLGIGHVDHVITARVMVRVLAERPGLDAWLYEDLPSRVLWPEEVPPALAVWRSWGWVPTISFLGTGPLELKEQAIDAYASQKWALHHHVIRCPERLHRLTRCD